MSSGQPPPQPPPDSPPGEPTINFNADKGWAHLFHAYLRTLPIALNYTARNREAVRRLTGRR